MPGMRERSKSQTKTDIQKSENGTGTEQESNESPRFRVLSCPREIENPDDRKVLDVVPHFEHGVPHNGPVNLGRRVFQIEKCEDNDCLLYTSPSPRDRQKSR